jgi:hypothetical protein
MLFITLSVRIYILIDFFLPKFVRLILLKIINFIIFYYGIL